MLPGRRVTAPVYDHLRPWGSRHRSEIVVESFVSICFVEFWSMFVQSWSLSLKPYTGVSHSQTILSGEGALSRGVLCSSSIASLCGLLFLPQLHVPAHARGVAQATARESGALDTHKSFLVFERQQVRVFKM